MKLQKHLSQIYQVLKSTVKISVKKERKVNEKKIFCSSFISCHGWNSFVRVQHIHNQHAGERCGRNYGSSG